MTERPTSVDLFRAIRVLHDQSMVARGDVGESLWRVLGWLMSECPTRKPGDPQEPDPLAGFEAYGSFDWDGYGAFPIPAKSLAIARQLLDAVSRPPDVAPGADGSVGLEWAVVGKPLRKLWVEVLNTGEVRIHAR